MKRIPLTRGQFALVDDNDYDYLMQWKWQAHQLKYGGFAAVRWRRKSEPSGPKTIQMSRVIMNAPAGFVVDHIYHDTLDNRKCKLRICTTSQNAYNRKPYGVSSEHKGVSRGPNNKGWTANISIQGKSHFLGTFEIEEDAAAAYKEESEKFHGEYCYVE